MWQAFWASPFGGVAVPFAAAILGGMLFAAGHWSAVRLQPKHPRIAAGVDAVTSALQGAVEAVYGRTAIAGPPLSGSAALLQFRAAVAAEAASRSLAVAQIDPVKLEQAVDSAIGRVLITDPNASITANVAVAAPVPNGGAAGAGSTPAGAVGAAVAAAQPAATVVEDATNIAAKLRDLIAHDRAGPPTAKG